MAKKQKMNWKSKANWGERFHLWANGLERQLLGLWSCTRVHLQLSSFQIVSSSSAACTIPSRPLGKGLVSCRGPQPILLLLLLPYSLPLTVEILPRLFVPIWSVFFWLNVETCSFNEQWPILQHQTLDEKQKIDKSILVFSDEFKRDGGPAAESIDLRNPSIANGS